MIIVLRMQVPESQCEVCSKSQTVAILAQDTIVAHHLNTSDCKGAGKVVGKKEENPAQDSGKIVRIPILSNLRENGRPSSSSSI